MDKCENFQVVSKHMIVLRKCILIPHTQLPYLVHFNTDLLENAVFNPESMLDFLDFVSAISPKDRHLLLDSLSLDYSGDVLANIIYPILYSDFEDDFVLDVINVLAESKSSLAIAPFEYAINTSQNQNIVNACQVGLKKLKL